MPEETSYPFHEVTINQDGISHKDFELTSSNSLWKAVLPDPGNQSVIEVKGYFRLDQVDDFQKFRFKITHANEAVFKRVEDLSWINVSAG